MPLCLNKTKIYFMEFFLKRLLFSLIFLILCNQNIQLLVSLFLINTNSERPLKETVKLKDNTSWYILETERYGIKSPSLLQFPIYKTFHLPCFVNFPYSCLRPFAFNVSWNTLKDMYISHVLNFLTLCFSATLSEKIFLSLPFKTTSPNLHLTTILVPCIIFLLSHLQLTTVSSMKAGT